MTDLADLKSYMKITGTSARWSDAELTAVLVTEMAAQTTRIKPAYLVAPIPAPVHEALMRRCLANLSRRALPLGVTDGSGDGSVATYVPGTDSEVRRLEAPFRKLYVG